jgi:hypothetical protein
MSLETFALGVISGIRPATSQAAVVALLKTPDPRRALVALLVAGFATSMLIGLVLVPAPGVDRKSQPCGNAGHIGARVETLALFGRVV